MSINYNSTSEEVSQQILDLAIKAVNGDKSAVTEIVDFCNFSLQGHAKWLGTKKGRIDNLALAIKVSMQHLQDNGLPLTNKNIIANLWIVDVGVDEFHRIIQDIVSKHNDNRIYVAWVDQRGIERTTKFSTIKTRIWAEKKRLDKD